MGCDIYRNFNFLIVRHTTSVNSSIVFVSPTLVWKWLKTSSLHQFRVNSTVVKVLFQLFNDCSQATNFIIEGLPLTSTRQSSLACGPKLRHFSACYGQDSKIAMELGSIFKASSLRHFKMRSAVVKALSQLFNGSSIAINSMLEDVVQDSQRNYVIGIFSLHQWNLPSLGLLLRFTSSSSVRRKCLQGTFV
ncbi:hypothetical protein JTE90_002147 [Oedothorax gibbosus]|uniref:Uncharacterized protein n=1 Tax=Oedothorax gibbosus TaxID=931172 RepID=A0AAV6V6Q4_9ARAC|nr:hypothetical protein JTE90_002147 [Oedothorax gibbosus]